MMIVLSGVMMIVLSGVTTARRRSGVPAGVRLLSGGDRSATAAIASLAVGHRGEAGTSSPAVAKIGLVVRTGKTMRNVLGEEGPPSERAAALAAPRVRTGPLAHRVRVPVHAQIPRRVTGRGGVGQTEPMATREAVGPVLTVPLAIGSALVVPLAAVDRNALTATGATGVVPRRRQHPGSRTTSPRNSFLVTRARNCAGFPRTSPRPSAGTSSPPSWRKTRRWRTGMPRRHASSPQGSVSCVR
jgi:hypothetical protein